MRTRARFARAREGNNVAPGTIIDSVITDDGHKNFFMVPHHALQGTARPSHYHILENEARADLLITR